MNKKITIAVFPVAGLGTRFLPATKAGPKEMLPIIDKPLIQYIAEEAINAGIKQLIFVTNNNKHAIEDYFSNNFELENHLEGRGKYEELSIVKNIIPDDINIAYVHQKHPLGLGHAVLQAKSLVGDQAFAVLLADDLIDCGENNCISMMIKEFEKTQSSVLGVETVPQSEVDKYGIVTLNNDSDLNRVSNIVEKPTCEEAKSNLAIVGRYILTPQIFDHLENTEKGAGNEIQLTDAIERLLSTEDVTAFSFPGKRFDCGSRIGFLQAAIAYAFKRPDMKDAIKSYIDNLYAEHS